jgi:ABC-type transport system involved in cytochrome c biogenesis ATPase subunit
LLDEPVSHLDEQNNQIAASIIMEQARLQGASIIATSVGNNIKISTDSTLRL